MQFTVDSPGRLDAFLAQQEGILSRQKAQRLIKEGCVEVDGEIMRKPALQLDEASEIVVSDVQRSGTAAQRNDSIGPVNQHLTILYEDDHCIAIDKPAGIAVHPGSGMDEREETTLNGIAYLFEERGIPFSNESVLVHRLDKETTGCLLIAKTPEAHSSLQKQFESRTVQKTYLTLVAGVPKAAEAMIDSPIGRNLTNRTKMSVLQTSKTRSAQTTYRTVENYGTHALLECDLHTGRTHQIRVHLSSIGHPVLGDDKYASAESAALSKELGKKNLCLHAWKLCFDSLDGKRIEIEAQVPDDMRQPERI